MSQQADRLIAWLGEVHAVPPFDVGGLVRDVEAAAEERGRRRGIEEAAKLLDAKIAAQKFFSYYVTDPRGGVSLQEGPHDVLLSARGVATEIRALAPRDSGKEDRK